MTSFDAVAVELVREIAHLEGVTVRAGISYGDLVQLEERLGVHLPAAYRALLLETNGLELTHGDRRLLGYGPGAPIDLVWFNDPETWMFAYRWWRQDLEDYLFLALSAEGVVTGCRRSDLSSRDNDPPPFTMHPLSLRPERGPARVSDWLQQGVRNQAHYPRGDMETSRYLDHFGSLPADKLIMPPPPTVDGEESLDVGVLLPAADVLIAEADLFRQERHAPPGTRVVGMDTWTDERGRTRLRYRLASETP